MKLSHLSLAIFTAISLAACGGSGNDNAVDNSGDTAKPPVDPNVKPEVAEIPDQVVDPTTTGVVGELDLKKSASQGTIQYIRDDGSLFDRENNKDKETSATAILGVNLNSQNPWLSNIALAQLRNKKGDATLVQYLGISPYQDVSDIKDKWSLQFQNDNNVDLLAKNEEANLAGTKLNEADFEKQIKALEEIVKLYKAQPSLTATQKDQYAVAQSQLEELNAVKEKMSASNAQLSYLLLPTDVAQSNTDFKWGDKVKTVAATLGVAGIGDYKSNPGTEPADDAANPHAIGLVGVNYQDANGDMQQFQGLEKNSESSTRIFGRYFDDNDMSSTDYHNSYLGATSVLLKSDRVDYSQPADFTEAEKEMAKKKKNAYTLAAIPNTLENVQYGRVTGDLDPATLAEANWDNGAGYYYKRQNFLTKGAAKAVDTYFYRGTNATTLDQMDKLPTDKKMTYMGHALMYGIDNSYHTDDGTNVPNAFGGVSAKHAIGNFVTATVDLDRGKLEEGKVYNVWQLDDASATDTNVLVEFEGNVFGNTVLGLAKRTYKGSGYDADFRASFFGENAGELGGSFNSTTWQDRYGTSGDVWGGVFGASRVDEEAQEKQQAALSNEWLGDIADKR